MQSAVVDRLELKMDLQAAVAENQFFLLYQPVFDLHTVTMCGVEALLRGGTPPGVSFPQTTSSPCLKRQV